MKVLLVSSDPEVRETLVLTVRSVERRMGEGLEVLEATDGLAGMKLAWRHLPDLVVADEITSHAGAFALARDLTNSGRTFPGHVVVLLDRAQDQWLARWSGADAWFVKPVNPFELADALAGFVSTPGEEAV